jgi:hypothetical protein
VTQLPALRPLFKYLPEEHQIWIPVYLLGWLAVYWLLFGTGRLGWLRRLLARPALPVALLAGLCAFNLVAYPYVDGLTKARNRGADQDDALIVAGQRLLEGHNPYEARTYTGNPPSPGPGWVMAVLPLSAGGLHGLLTPLLLAACALWVWRVGRNAYQASLFVLTLMSSLAAWEVMVNGSDMLAMGLLFVICAGLIHARWGRGWSWDLAVLAVLCVAATTRLVFAALVPLFALFLWNRDRRAGLRLLLLGGSATVALHALFWAWNTQSYTPAHVLAKGYRVAGPWMLVVGAAATLAALLAARVALRDDPVSWLQFLWLCLFASLGLLGLVDLAINWGKAYPLSGWEGANYLMIPLPAFVAAFCLGEAGQASIRNRADQGG